MRNLVYFVLVAAVFEVVALITSTTGHANWILAIIVLLIILFLLFKAFAGWRKQQNLDLPQIMTGKVVKRRHWRLF